VSASPSAYFDNNCRWDRNFFLLYVVIVWIGICMGFGLDIADHVKAHAPPYPLIVYLHAVAFVGWLVLLTVQVLLIRARRADIHRKLGVAGVVLACVMLVLGPMTAIIVDRLQFGTPDSDPAFLSVQLTDILAFTGFVTFAIAMRNRPAAHKRLMLLAILYISEAGFSRWLAPDMRALLGVGFWGMVATVYLASDVLIVGLGAYDFITRRQLHPAYVAAVPWALAIQLTAVRLYFSPGWKTIALRILGH
jgi:hypothetical protein